jgi:hypothetical protein
MDMIKLAGGYGFHKSCLVMWHLSVCLIPLSDTEWSAFYYVVIKLSLI